MGHFSAADDLHHDISSFKHGRESLFWVFPLPDAGALAMTYLWRDAHDGKYGRIVALTDHFGGEPSYIDVQAGLDLEGDDFDDCVAAGLHVRQRDPLKTAALDYDDGEFALHLRLEGLHEPFSWRDGLGGCPEWAAHDRYEQSTRTAGQITIGGTQIELGGGIGHRDHSWGSRDWRPLQHWKWMNASTLDGELTFHGWISFALGERQVNGYVNRGGVLSPIVEAEAHSQLDHEFMHKQVSGRFKSLDGLELLMEADGVAGMPLSARHMQMQEVACTATLDGRPAIAHIEHGWPASYIQDYVNEGQPALTSDKR
jgi:hypothetical protein